MCDCLHRARARKILLKNGASTRIFSLSIGKFCGQVSRKPLARFMLSTAPKDGYECSPLSSFYSVAKGGINLVFVVRKVKSVVSNLTELRRFPDCQFTSAKLLCQNARSGLLQSATRNRDRQKVLAIQSFCRECSRFLRASGQAVATTSASRCGGKTSGNHCTR